MKLKILSWNIGNCVYSDYYSYRKSQDAIYFKNLLPAKRSEVLANLSGVVNIIKKTKSDIVLFQEVAKTTPVTRFVNLYNYLINNLTEYQSNYLKHYNILGFINHGKATFIKHEASFEAIKMPIKMKTLKDDIFLGNKTVIKTSVKTNNEIIVVFNVHFVAFLRNHEDRLKQIKYVLELAKKELEKDNHVIIGGDFNMDMPDEKTTHESFSKDILNNIESSGFYFAIPKTPTLRSLEKPYSNNSKKRTIDGFICSKSIEVDSIENLNIFKYSDHSPIILNCKTRKN